MELRKDLNIAREKKALSMQNPTSFDQKAFYNHIQERGNSSLSPADNASLLMKRTLREHIIKGNE
jgi:hypothetical protein